MTVGELEHRMSALEYRDRVTLENVRAQEQKRAMNKAKRRGR